MEILDWEKAKKHFDCVYQSYLGLRDTPGVNVEFALNYVFEPMKRRFEGGERTLELYEEMNEVE